MEGKTIFGLPAWQVLLVLAGAGVVGYMLFFRNRGGAASSAADTTTGAFSQQGLAVMANPDFSGSISSMNQELIDGFNAQHEDLLNTLYATNQVAFAAGEQTTNPSDAVSRLNAAQSVWLGMGGDPSGQPPAILAQQPAASGTGTGLSSVTGVAQ